MEYLYLKWIDYRNNKKYLIGALFRDKQKGKYYFRLSKAHVEKAIKDGAISEIILPFSDYDKIYESNEIFAIFKIRLPKLENYETEELEELLKDLDMKEYDDFEYLRKTKGMLETDNFVVEEEK